MSPFICGFQDNMSNWISCLIQQQDGCLQLVAHHATQGRLRQKQLAQTFAHHATMPSQNDKVNYFRAQLAHREVQLEQIRAERDNHFIQEEEDEEKHDKQHANTYASDSSTRRLDCLSVCGLLGCPTMQQNERMDIAIGVEGFVESWLNLKQHEMAKRISALVA